MPKPATEQLKKYFLLKIQFPDMSKMARKRLAGYAESTGTETIERGEAYQEMERQYDHHCKTLGLDIDGRITQAQRESGAGVANNLTVLYSVLNDKKSKKRDKIAAAKEIRKTTREERPEQIVANINTDEELLSRLLSNSVKKKDKD